MQWFLTDIFRMMFSSVIRQKGESQNGGNKKAKHAKSSKKRTFFTPWYAHVHIIWSDIVYLSRPYHVKFFEGCLPQISLGPFLNTLSQMLLLSIKVLERKSVGNYAHSVSVTMFTIN